MEFEREITFFSTANKEGFDIIVYQCGMEKCKPSYAFGPAVRDHFLIHFILEGKGTFRVKDKSYKLEKNQGFLIYPDTITYYEADKEEPWIYTWVGFKGIKAKNYLKLANLDEENPIFKYEEGDFIKNCFEDMRKASTLKNGKELRLQGLLSIFLSELIEKSPNSKIIDNNYKEVYVKKTLDFIETNFSRDITVPEMAKNVGLNKNYFSSFFRENIGISPQQYLIKFRMNKACELMKNSTLTISDVSRSVGYNDPLGFSKIFKKTIGLSPKAYRESHFKLM
ncbi:AraC family transcriptional regulator [Clostridium pasteurianum]|uniref:DNA-binding domain-containing protein, AraC-type n=1 Tax=Clostridium pasteurianum BC1 TaxID=86416 RepID=R4JY48_CLOPA|nr:AraC family transcriptional regulator [Clostridium pasteurianum]AGK95737.1 DNA-binding domain-containing protein, AraC-type [Clostridium pasteurianum BC1]